MTTTTSRAFAACCLLLLMLGSLNNASAQTSFWTGDSDPRFWSVGGNWNTGQIPNSTRNVNFSFAIPDAIYPTEANGLRVFNGLQVNDFLLSRIPLYFRPEGTFTVAGELQIIDQGDLVLQNFAGATRLNAGNLRLVDGTLTTTPTTTVSAGSATIDNSTINLNGGSLIVQGESTITGDSTILLRNGSTWTNAGTIQFNGAVRLLDSNTRMTVGGSLFTLGQGIVDINGGTLEVGSLSGAVTSSVRLTYGTLRVNAGVSNARFIDDGNIYLRSAALLDIAGTLHLSQTDSVTLNGGSLQTGDIQLSGGAIRGGFNVASSSRSNRIQGRGSIEGVIGGNANSVIAATNGSLILGGLNLAQPLDSYLGEIQGNSNTVLVLSSEQARLRGRTSFSGDGRLASLSGLELMPSATLTTTGDATVDGDFTNNGTINASAVDGEWLTFVDDVNGAGAFSGNIRFSDGFSPGNSPAAVQLDNLALDGTSNLAIEIGGAMPGTEYDQLLVAGDLELNGLLTLSMINNFAPAPGQAFTIIDVGGERHGEFAGLPEGAAVGNFGGRDLFVTYQAGDGNDVALFTAVPEPAALLLMLGVATAMALTGRRRVPLAMPVY